jgi:hypothetical protein
MKIKAPKAKNNYPDRFEDCQTAIEEVFVQLLVEATRAGWHHEEVLAAITSVADITALLSNLMKKKE